jgi:hypothetical protein
MITVSANGGTGSRTYSNNGGAFQTSNVFSGLADGTYTITTRDANSCTTTCVATIQGSSGFNLFSYSYQCSV